MASARDTSDLLPERPVRQRLHGRELVDPYGWLDSVTTSDPDVAAFLDRLGERSKQMLEHVEPFTDLIKAASRRHEPRGITAAPVRQGQFSYRFQTGVRGGRLLYQSGPDGLERLVLDGDRLEQPDPIAMWGASNDGRWLAWGMRSGPETCTIRVLDTVTGSVLADRVDNARINIDLSLIVWLLDGSGFFHAQIDEGGRPFQACLHRLGTSQSQDLVLYEESDPSFFLDIRRTSSRQHALLECTSTDTSEVRLVRLDGIDLALQLVWPRRKGVSYRVDEAQNELLIVTNDTEPNMRLVRAPIRAPTEITEVLAARPDVGLSWHQATDRNWIVVEKTRGGDRIRVIDKGNSDNKFVALPNDAQVAGFDRWNAGPDVNGDAESEALVVGWQGLALPPALAAADLVTGHLHSLAPAIRPAVMSGTLRVMKLEATMDDGEVVPISLLCRADIAPARHFGVVLYGYGAYGNPAPANFDPIRIGLLEQNVMFAIAHVRGGGDLGGAWHEAGRGERRTRPVLDFLGCARWLVRSGLVQRGRIVAEGHSAGAWTAAAAVNRDPGLFGGALLHVPYLDVLTNLLDPTSPTAAMERPETGDPLTDPSALDRVLSIDPCRSMPASGYPPTFITAVETDTRISWRGVVKFAAHVSSLSAGTHLCLQIAPDGSHWGPSDQQLAENWPLQRYGFALAALIGALN